MTRRGNLWSVRQAGTCTQDPISQPCAGGTSRTFGYSSLGRLTGASNPENGAISYQYDFAGKPGHAYRTGRDPDERPTTD